MALVARCLQEMRIFSVRVCCGGARGSLAAAAAGLVALLVLVGCGSSATHHSTSTATQHSTSTPTSSTASAASGESAKPPAQILADSTAALRAAPSYAMQGTIAQNGQRMRLRLTTITKPKSLDLAFAIGGSAVELIELPDAGYVRANARFFRTHGGGRVVQLAGRWIQVPSANARTTTSSLGVFAPATLARCLAENHGTLSTAGETTVDGRRAILLKDAGDKPGSAPSVLAVAASGTPYPLRFTGTGRQRAGGRIDVCNNGKASDSRGSVTFGQFSQVAPIQAPKNVVRAAPSSPGT